MELIEELKELNLDDNEIRVYQTCLNLGSCKVNDISQKTTILRTTIYGILKSLIQKGLISSFTKDNVKYYNAANPKQLLEILEEKKKILSSAMPKLEKIHNFVPNKHKIELFEGKQGFKTIVNQLVSIKDNKYYIVGPFSTWIDFSEFYTTTFYRRKKEMNVKAKIITDIKDKKNIHKKRTLNSEFKFLNNFDTVAEFILWQNKVAIISFEKDNLKGVIIEDKEIAKMYKIIFDNLWEKAKK